MIVAVDVETQGLDATKYIIGCIITERTPNKPEYYTNKKELWNRLLELGKKEAKRNKTLNVYSHNATYDFYSYANITDKNLHYYSHKPFITAYKHNNKEIIKFLDTLAIYKMPLKKIGELINLPKLETPLELLEEQQRKITPELINTIKPYLKRDTEIVLQAILQLKTKLKNENINIKRLYTINQIAISYLINKLKQQPNANDILWNTNTGEIKRTLRAKEIHEAYRGARVQCFKTGIHHNTTYIDCNSLYPYSLTQITIPKLETERKYNTPTQEELQQHLKKEGYTRCLIKNNTNTIGILPIRTPTQSYYPTQNKYLIGTWTHQELRQAQKEGYTILTAEWTVLYEENLKTNPFKRIIEETYQKRKEAKTTYEKQYYKDLMNRGIGKFAQTKQNQEIIIDDIEKAEEYLKKNYNMLKGLDYNIIYQNQTTPTNKHKPYYCPAIPTNVNAYARLYMYQQYKKIPEKDRLYTDTDSLMYTGNHTNKFNIGNEMGEFKIEHKNQTATIYGNKTYTIENKIIIAGFNKKDITPEQLKTGIINTKRMQTIKTAKNIQDIGTFTTETRNLNKQQENTKEIRRKYEEKDLHIDYNLTNIKHFLKILTQELRATNI